MVKTDCSGGGFFDSLKYENSVPILGSTLSTKTKLFNKIVDNCKTVYICLDQDARKKELRIVKKLLDFGINVCKIKLYEYSDLGEVPDHLLGEYKNHFYCYEARLFTTKT